MSNRQNYKSPLISIITPMYNAANFIAETCDSVIKQTYINWEMIIIDDCSTDNSVEIVSEISKNHQRIKLLKAPKNYGGPAGPRNIGINSANGQYVAFLDSDDIWFPEKLESQIDIIRNNNAYMCCTAMQPFTDIVQLTTHISTSQTKVINFKNNQIKNRIATSSVIIDKRCLEMFPFNESIEYKAVEDYDCWLKILKHYGPCQKIKYPLIGYRKSTDQISSNKLDMLQKVYRVHINTFHLTKFRALLYTFTHLTGGILQNVFRKGI